MNVPRRLIVLLVPTLVSVPACQPHGSEEAHGEHHTIVVTSPEVRDVTITQKYVCQIRARRHIEVCALQDGYLESIEVKEGQRVKKGDLLFKILPTLYKARLAAEQAEAQLARIEYENTKKLFEQVPPVVSEQQVKLAKAKLDKANAKAELAAAELNFTNIVAPYDGIVDRFQRQLGSLIEQKDVLTTLSDNDLMWVYFNVPEARYLEYMSDVSKHKLKLPIPSMTTPTTKINSKDKDDDDDDDDDKKPQGTRPRQIELVLANGNKFHQPGVIGAIEATFNNENGNIPFRADFPNPNGLLRHGQTGTMLIHRQLEGAIVIPQRATFEILDKQYVWVIGDDRVAHQRPIVVQHEMEDIFVVSSGLSAKDKIILEGVRQVHDGQEVEYEFESADKALKHQKFHAE